MSFADLFALVAVTVPSLSESPVANRALERFLALVGSQVVSQVAEFGELQVATAALKHLVDSLGLFIFGQNNHVAFFLDDADGLLLLQALLHLERLHLQVADTCFRRVF